MSDRQGVTFNPLPTDPRIGVLRIDRPPVNAMSQAMWDGFADIGRALHDDSPLRAVVIAGTRHFAAGADITEMSGLSAADFEQRNRVLQGAFALIATAPQIVIAAIDGYALGGGCELALAADIRIAGRRAVLGLPEITLGIMPGSGGTQRLAHIVGLAVAKEMILNGLPRDANQALAVGLVDEVVDNPFARAVERASTFADGPFALRWAKRAVQASLDLPLEEGLEFEARAVAACFDSADGRRGLQAFREHGASARPEFTGT